MAHNGRPSFHPTDRQRGQVEAMCACGIPEKEIAQVLDISPTTLRKHFRRELDHNYQRRLRPPKTQIAHYRPSLPIVHTVTKPNAAVITQPSFLFETESSGHTQALTKSP
jgi:AraC-like DNA-binding protein